MPGWQRFSAKPLQRYRRGGDTPSGTHSRVFDTAVAGGTYATSLHVAAGGQALLLLWNHCGTGGAGHPRAAARVLAPARAAAQRSAPAVEKGGGRLRRCPRLPPSGDSATGQQQPAWRPWAAGAVFQRRREMFSELLFIFIFYFNFSLSTVPPRSGADCQETRFFHRGMLNADGPRAARGGHVHARGGLAGISRVFTVGSRAARREGSDT